MDISAYQHMNIRMSTRGKRPLRNLTPNDKVRAIQRIHNGETKASVSRDIGVPESTLRGWCKNEQKLRFMCRQLGPDHLGLTALDSPPEKRTKFDLQLLPPKFGSMPPNYDDLGFAGLPFPAMDFSAHNEALLEKLAFVEFMKKNGLHPDAMQQIGDTNAANAAAAAAAAAAAVTSSPSADYPGNNMLHQLNLLALLNPKLAAETANITDLPKPKTASIPVPTSASVPTTLALPPHPLPRPASVSSSSDEPKSVSSPPLLSVKNWATDPAKLLAADSQRQSNNDSNNNDVVDISINGCSQMPPAAVSVSPPPPPSPQISTPPFGANAAATTNLDSASLLAMQAMQLAEGEGGGGSQGTALLDWCKMFSASLNFLAFAAAAASIQPAGSSMPGTASELDDTVSLIGSSALFKRLNPLVHSDASDESYCDDSEPEDLSVRSSASKISSPANSRSQSPDKSSASSVIHSDGEQ